LNIGTYLFLNIDNIDGHIANVDDTENEGFKGRIDSSSANKNLFDLNIRICPT